jgi:2-iminobutanoate/2-iminopropanoate deaminase
MHASPTINPEAHAMLTTISTDKAPKAIGPYSQAIVANGMVFVSGQIPLDPASGQLIGGTIADQTHRVLQNISQILESANSMLAHTVKTTVYLKDMSDFEEMNRVYGEYFTAHKPARATVQVSRLPKDVSIEIDAIAVI